MIRIVIPFYSEFDTAKPGLRSLLGSGLSFELHPVQGALVHNNRNAGVNNQRSYQTFQLPVEGYTHFLFIDSDIGFSPAHVHLALKHSADIVTLPYLTHENLDTYQVGELEPNKTRIIKKYAKSERGLRHVSFTGAGFLLVARHVFADLAYPWFHCGMVEEGSESRTVGEDVMFCTKVRDRGYSILCDFDHPVFHKPRKASNFNVSL
jgi:hypothetical protein